MVVVRGPESPWCDAERLARKAEREKMRGGQEKKGVKQSLTTEVTEEGTGHNRCGEEELPKSWVWPCFLR